ncbi:hypothetical protein PIB30_003497 [Stylosanthes scabra]|uniref:Uncharacterized protein n=1 Tax=Stylosanthes scabra TaxID=79078 RepID=A0ABU6V4U0_9FABA|nr:hypothetical protein [Stylosanthes scabra]
MRVTHYDQRNSVFLVEDGKPGCMWEHRQYRRVPRISLLVAPCNCCLCIRRIRVGASVDPVFTVANLFKVYEMEFLPIPDENLRPEWMGSNLQLNPHMKRKNKGR